MHKATVFYILFCWKHQLLAEFMSFNPSELLSTVLFIQAIMYILIYMYIYIYAYILHIEKKNHDNKRLLNGGGNSEGGARTRRGLNR